MTLPDIVCDIEYSKRLKELGVKQESLFYWVKMSHGNWNLGLYSEITQWQGYDSISAWTVAELGEKLPTAINGTSIIIFKNDYGEYICSDESPEATFSDTKLSNSLAKMLIHLIKEGVIKL